ncbi:MAG: hypothetical protein QG579_200 [Patescibacteria group bacterium]|jgi:hypothetical protein|nr:hypothetical protein [Patescibacteria group bacterium]
MSKFEQIPEDAPEIKNTSRRDFIKKVIAPDNERGGSQKDVHLDKVFSSTGKIDRRDFTKLLTALLIGITTTNVSATEDSDISQSDNLIPADSANQFFNPDKAKYLETSIESAFVIAGKAIASNIAESLGIPVSNNEKFITALKEKPFSMLFNANVVGPFSEETMFRLVPSLFVGSEGNKWGAGIPAAILFGLLHNVDKDSFGEIKFNSTIPLSEFMGGIFYWYLIRHRGFDHAVLAHSINNTTASLVLLIDNIIKSE